MQIIYNGLVMSKNLPTGGFEWIKDFDSIDILNHDSDHDIGYVLEVDVEYPKTLSKQHNEIPFLSEKMKL